MAKKDSEATPTEKHYDQLRAMFEEAEIDFEEGENPLDGSYIDIPHVMVFNFDSEGALTGVNHD